MVTISAPRYWREIPHRYRLIGNRCLDCGEVYFPCRLVCRKCGSRKFEDYKLSEKGRLITFTVIHRDAPIGFTRQVPYVVGIVQLNEGVKILSQIVDCDPYEVYVGMPVELSFRKIRESGKEGIIEYGFKFRPALR